jgi:hypothetical protein
MDSVHESGRFLSFVTLSRFKMDVFLSSGRSWKRDSRKSKRASRDRPKVVVVAALWVLISEAFNVLMFAYENTKGLSKPCRSAFLGNLNMIVAQHENSRREPVAIARCDLHAWTVLYGVIRPHPSSYDNYQRILPAICSLSR